MQTKFLLRKILGESKGREQEQVDTIDAVYLGLTILKRLPSTLRWQLWFGWITKSMSCLFLKSAVSTVGFSSFYVNNVTAQFLVTGNRNILVQCVLKWFWVNKIMTYIGMENFPDHFHPHCALQTWKLHLFELCRKQLLQLRLQGTFCCGDWKHEDEQSFSVICLSLDKELPVNLLSLAFFPL